MVETLSFQCRGRGLDAAQPKIKFKKIKRERKRCKKNGTKRALISVRNGPPRWC